MATYLNKETQTDRHAVGQTYKTNSNYLQKQNTQQTNNAQRKEGAEAIS